jgi:hypothetical protein
MIAADLGMANVKKKDDIISAFPQYFYQYLMKNNTAKFLSKSQDNGNITGTT